MIWRLPDTYHSAGHRRGTATFKFYEGRDILLDEALEVLPAELRRLVEPMDAELLAWGKP